MPRSSTVVELRSVPASLVAPVVGGEGPTLRSALQAIVTWGSSRTLREQVMNESGFPLPDDLPAFLVVNQLIYRGLSRPTDLADAIDTSRSNMSKIAARLESEGLVFRASDPRDERGVVLGLTERGRAVAARIVASSLDETSLPGWEPSELRQLERLVVRFAETIDALPGHPIEQLAGYRLRGSTGGSTAPVSRSRITIEG